MQIDTVIVGMLMNQGQVVPLDDFNANSPTHKAMGRRP